MITCRTNHSRRFTAGGRGLALGLLLLSACQSPSPTPPDHGSHAAGAAGGAGQASPAPAHVLEAADTLRIDAGQQQRAGLQTVVVTARTLPAGQQVLGTVAADETRTEIVSARVDGRLDYLFANTPGQVIHKGQPLYALYSETLLADAQEYRRGLHQAGRGAGDPDRALLALSAAAARKLRLQGVSAAQLTALASARQMPATLRFDSPVGGYLAELLVRQGQYVRRGTPLLRITNAATVWVEAQVYASELALLQQLGKVTVEADAFPGQQFPARLVDARPALEENRKINLIRLRVANPNGLLRPGMMATVQLGRAELTGLAVPYSALQVGKMTTVWVQTAPTVFERRMVRPGKRAGSYVELLSGVEPGEWVVSCGAYLLESELELRRGGGNMANMAM